MVAVGEKKKEFNVLLCVKEANNEIILVKATLWKII